MNEHRFSFSLESLIIPDTVTTLGKYVFMGCSSLISVTIPDCVTSIGESPFYNCMNLTNLAVSENNENYSVSDDGKILYNKDKTKLISCCSAVTGDITIPDSVTTIDMYAFNGCLNLTSVIIPDSVTTIGSCAIVNCPNLANITIGKGLSSIGSQAFAYNTKAVFNIDENNANYSSSTDGKMLLSKDQTTLLAYPSAEGDITIPESVTKIEIFVFSGYSSRLTSVTFAGTGTWYYTENSDYTDGTEIDVTNPVMNATYLADWDTYEYYNKYWYKQ